MGVVQWRQILNAFDIINDSWCNGNGIIALFTTLNHSMADSRQISEGKS
jgi:hypothetical protein